MRAQHATAKFNLVVVESAASGIKGGDVMENYEERWQQLFLELQRATDGDAASETEDARVSVLLGAVHLIQPFDWNAWQEPWPSADDVGGLTMEQCVKHVTRIARANRFNEGVLSASIQSGLLASLCRVAYERAAGGRVPALADLA